MFRTAILAILLAAGFMASATLKSHALYCQQTCQHYGNQTTCNTNCY